MLFADNSLVGLFSVMAALYALHLVLKRGQSEKLHGDQKERDIETLSDFEIIDSKLFGYKRNLPIIYVPSNVVTIKNNAFENMAMTAVFIPSSVKTIEKHAFLNCTSLKTVIFESDFRHLDDGVFQNCSSLSFLSNLKTIEFLGDNAISNTQLNVFNETEFEDSNVFRTIISQMIRIRIDQYLINIY